MSNRIIQMRNKTRGKSVEDLAYLLREEINADMIFGKPCQIGGGDVALLCFERMYFRNGSYASLAVMLTDDGEVQTADIIGYGGGEGLGNFSWGANRNFAEMAEEVLRKQGFQTYSDQKI